MMNKQGTIYKIENLVNGKVYIGQTVNKPQRRIQCHRSLLKRNIHDNDHLQKAWNKYGEENFKFEIIENYPLHELDNIEIELISKYRKINKCYNLESGGNSQKELSESTKNKLSKSIKNLHANNKEFRLKFLEGRARKVICIDTGGVYNSIAEASEEFNINYKNLHQACCGNSNSAKGIDGNYYQFAYYEKGKIYTIKELKNINETKEVVCVNTGEVFNSASEASVKTGIQQTHISHCCVGKRNFAGRLENGDWIAWVFKEEYNSNEEYSFKRIRIQSEETRNKISSANKISKKILRRYTTKDIDTGKAITFDNDEDLVDYLKILGYENPDIYSVRRCCNGKRKTAYKHKWEYA